MRTVFHRQGSRSVGVSFSDLVFFVALLATALAMGGALGHALEFPAKLSLARDDYFTVQQIYRGWDMLGYVLGVQLIALLSVAIAVRREPTALWFALAALLCLGGAQAVFWLFTQPANAATANWTFVPDNWLQLRRQWEYSHVAGAGLQVLAMATTAMAALTRARG